MKRFSFRLDGILSYRRYQERRAHRDLVNARHEQAQRQRAAKQLSDKRMEAAEACTEEGFEGMDVPRYHLYKSFLRSLSKDIHKAHLKLRQGEEEIHAKESVLTRRSVEKKSLEVLRDLKVKAYNLSIEQEEQKAMDELVILRKDRKP
ncbi:MAG: flagellar export protein FliJ [Deltaproteobacteria bacterium]|nr:MAG: flagellar export protein FliJ [Deltaproteobacteria bacterium]